MALTHSQCYTVLCIIYSVLTEKNNEDVFLVQDGGLRHCLLSAPDSKVEGKHTCTPKNKRETSEVLRARLFKEAQECKEPEGCERTQKPLSQPPLGSQGWEPTFCAPARTCPRGQHPEPRSPLPSHPITPAGEDRAQRMGAHLPRSRSHLPGRTGPEEGRGC